MSKKAFLLLSILLFVCHLSNAQTKVDWKQIKNTPHSFSGYGITEFDFPATASITLGEVNATSGSIGNLTSTSVTTDSLSAESIETNSIETETIEGTTGHFLNMDVDQSITAGMHVYVGSGDTRGDFSGEGLTTRVLTLNPVRNAPSMARVGSLYYNSNDHKIYINENGTWKPLAQEVRIELPSTIESDYITFDGKLNVTDGITTTEVTTTEINAHDITATGSVSITEDLSVGGDVSVTGDISNPNGKILTKEVMFTPSTTGIQAIKGAVYYNSSTNKLLVCTGFDSDEEPVWESLNGSEITIDSTIIANSTNPVQSKAIQEYVDTKIAAIPSPTIDNAMSGTSTNAVQNKVIKNYVDTHISTVDSAMSSTSTNPVQNKVVKDYIDNHTSEAGVIPTTIPENPQTGSVYWVTGGNYVRIYTGTSWRNFYPQESINDISNGVYVQNSMYGYYSGVYYDFVDGTALTSDNQVCYFPMLQSSDNGSSYTDVNGYLKGHFYCLGYERISSYEVKITLLFPICSVATTNYASEADLNNLVREIAQERGDTLSSYIYYTSNGAQYEMIYKLSNYGLFGPDSPFNYNNKSYKFNFSTSTSKITPNILRYDSTISINTIKSNIDETLPLNVGSDFTIRINLGNGRENTTTSGDQAYLYGTGVWAEIIYPFRN